MGPKYESIVGEVLSLSEGVLASILTPDANAAGNKTSGAHFHACIAERGSELLHGVLLESGDAALVSLNTVWPIRSGRDCTHKRT